MRIIAGKYRGRQLASLPKDVRPSSDRLRETLFNVLADSVEDSVWLDLFGGSGAVGIEALSRGARHVIFNDKSRGAVRLIQKNLDRCGIETGYEIHQGDALSFLRKLNGPAVDFVFLDPPYGFERYPKLLQMVSRSPVVHDHSLTILEVFKKQRLEKVPEHLASIRTLTVGDSLMLFLRPSEGDQDETRAE